MADTFITRGSPPLTTENSVRGTHFLEMPGDIALRIAKFEAIGAYQFELR